jgi:DNA-binding LacI/PurR family transcriptional regulator
LGQHREILPLLNNVECVIYNYVFDGGYRDAELEKNGIFMVGPDEDKINEELGFFLKNLGHRNIAVSEYYESLEACGSSFLAGLEKTGLNTVKLDQPELMAFGIDELASYFADTIISLMKSAEITAAAFLDDEIAAAVMMELIRGGIKIPEQLTITGFDNLKFTNFLAVPLTTVKMPVREMVKQTIRIFEEDTEAYRFPFPLEIIKRKSHREVFSEG